MRVRRRRVQIELPPFGSDHRSVVRLAGAVDDGRVTPAHVRAVPSCFVRVSKLLVQENSEGLAPHLDPYVPTTWGDGERRDRCSAVVGCVSQQGSGARYLPGDIPDSVHPVEEWVEVSVGGVIADM